MASSTFTAGGVPIGPPSQPGGVTAAVAPGSLPVTPSSPSTQAGTVPGIDYPTAAANGGHRAAESVASSGLLSSSGAAGSDVSGHSGTGAIRDGPATGKLVPYPALPTVLSGIGEQEEDGVQRQATGYPPTPAPPGPAIAPPADTPKVALTLLLLTGQRRLVRFDPQTTIARVKELIWASWPAEWTAAGVGQPDGPSWLRVLWRGRMLDDERTLAGEGLAVVAEGRSTIVHLSVRTFPIETDEDGKDGKVGSNEAPVRPALHTRASSRLRSLVVGPDAPETTGANSPAAINGGAPVVAPLAGRQEGGARRGNRRRSQSNATNSTSDTHAGSSGCGCVIA